MSDHDLLLGFDIGGTKSSVVLGDTGGRVIDRHECPTIDPDHTLAILLDAARPMCADRRPTAAGVSVGSPLDRQRGLIQAPANLPDWIDVPVVQRIQQVFDIPVNLENDADAGALAEWVWGLNRQVDDMAYLTCGTGQGGGLILGGRLHRGVSNLAGEIGHVRLRPDGPIGCNKAGSVEGFTSGKALAERARRMGMSDDGLTGRDVGQAARVGDILALKVVDEHAADLGRTCAILIDVLNPQRISLGSLVIRLGDLMLPTIRRVAEEESMPRAFAACTIDAAALGDRVQDLAALATATLALEH